MKKKIIIASVLAVLFLFISSLLIVTINQKFKESEEQEVFISRPFIKKVYCFHKKTFPAPYTLVGGLPSL